jgi:hypothetical protein
MKREPSTKKIWVSGAHGFMYANRPQRGYRGNNVMEQSIGTSSIEVNASSNGITSNLTAPHRKNAAQSKSDSPYQGRTAQRDNPTQLIIKQAVEFLIEQVRAGKSGTLTAYLAAMARFHNYSFLC